MAASFKFKVDFTPAKRVVGTLRGTNKRARLAMAEGTYRDSQKLVPVDTGELKRSGKVTQLKHHAKVLYGSAKVKYATIVHNVNRAYQNGQWQYLRQPLMDARARLNDAAEVFKRSFTDMAARNIERRFFK